MRALKGGSGRACPSHPLPQKASLKSPLPSRGKRFGTERSHVRSEEWTLSTQHCQVQSGWLLRVRTLRHKGVSRNDPGLIINYGGPGITSCYSSLGRATGSVLDSFQAHKSDPQVGRSQGTQQRPGSHTAGRAMPEGARGPPSGAAGSLQAPGKSFWLQVSLGHQ